MVPASAQTLTTLVTFNGSNGANPQFGALVQGLNGSLYGTTFYGGAYSQGTVFELTTSGELTTIYSFCARKACKDGANPESGLVLGPNGDLYGTTNGGGNYNLGTVFEIASTSPGRFKTLYNFCSLPLCGDGEVPTDSLLLGPDGNFYGTTWGGGKRGSPNGTVFRLTPAGQLTTLRRFCTANNGQWCLDGASPYGGLTYAQDGNYYGMTYVGGTSDAGAIYSVSPSGQFSPVYSFCTTKPCENVNPAATLMQSANGKLYGTSYDGNLYGAIFEFRNGVGVKNLYNFCQLAECADGYFPSGALLQGTDGNFYGTTTSGGVNPCNGSCGTLFEITPTGALTTLYRFCSQANCTDGKRPEGSLMQATDGNFYGVTYSGGDLACLDGCGTAFRLATGLQPFVLVNPSASPEGTTVAILGNHLNGSSVVRFNGAAATFRVVSETEITATVPVGATSGMVTVTTPSGTLSSNIVFRVP